MLSVRFKLHYLLTDSATILNSGTLKHKTKLAEINMKCRSRRVYVDRRHAGSRHSVLRYSVFYPDQPVGNLYLLLSQNTAITGFESIIQEREIPKTIMTVFSENILFIPVSRNVRTAVLVCIYCRVQLFVLLSIIRWTFATETSAEIRNVGCQVQW
jgi:hypothetical protein